MSAYIAQKPSVKINGSKRKGYFIKLFDGVMPYQTAPVTHEELKLLYQKLRVKLEK